MFICGSGSFGHQDDYENESYGSPCPTPKRSKRTTSFCKILGKDNNNNNKNPYANRGLDKFYALLADLDDKKQKIYTRMGAEDISFVQFVYTNDSDRVKPIVVRVKENNNNKSIKKSTSNVTNQPDADAPADHKTLANRITTGDQEIVNEQPRRRRRCLRCNGVMSFKMDMLRRPHFYFPVIVVLVLLFLAMYGRSFAIMCTSIGWYMVPSVVGGSSSSSSSNSTNERKPKRKKEYVRKQSEKKIVHSSEGLASPKSVINGLMENKA